MAHPDVACGVPSGEAIDQHRWIVFQDESGTALTSVVGRTWGKRGQTPVIQLNGSRRGRDNMTAFLAYRAGEPPRLYAWAKTGDGYTKDDFPLLLTMLHARLDGPVTLIWDNYSSHTSHLVRDWTRQQPWLKVVPLPPYAPELNPVELLWKIVKDRIANRAFRSIQELADADDAALSTIKKNATLLIGFLAGTRLPLPEVLSSA
ncbi:IS630 family transposase [Streptacidiphilus albus]|uniref:IS630 family transposase n=1 Tax=Streptacidiphilus albus TaxID=105425 RepID=UPI0005A92F9C|nr:IS630 family transposase [Streptacidiphilus albus]